MKNEERSFFRFLVDEEQLAGSQTQYRAAETGLDRSLMGSLSALVFAYSRRNGSTIRKMQVIDGWVVTIGGGFNSSSSYVNESIVE